MPKQFILTGFSDEISPDIKEQFENLQKLGIRHFEIRGVNEKNVADLTLAEAEEVKALGESYGITASSVGSPIGKIGITDDFAEHLEKLKHVIEIAKVLGTGYIRVFSFYIPKGEDPASYREEVLHRMKAMTALAEQEGVTLLHENEKGIYGDTAPRCLDILKSVNSPHLRAVFDPANFVECGQVTYPDAFDLLCDYVVYMHIKDCTADKHIVPAGEGIGQVEEILSQLYRGGYRGFVSLEPHLAQFAGLSALQDDTSVVNEEKAGPRTFKIAYDALVKIIERIEK